MNIEFKDQVVLVTGGTRGIGKQIADDFSELGANLLITGTKPKEQNEIDTNVRYYCVDFSNKESSVKFFSEISKLNRIDVCINNAGINRINFIDETLVEDWNDIVSVNLEAPFMITREISKIMKKNRYGRIINISSIFGIVSKEKRSIYSVTKFGLRGLTVSTSNELAKYNILVNAVSPGFVLTDLTKRMLSEEEIEELSSQVPIKRFAMPDEISRVVMFLSSKCNTYLTGQNILVDGGFVNV